MAAYIFAAVKKVLDSFAGRQVLNLVELLIQELVCLISYEDKVKELYQYVEYLQEKRGRVQHQVDDAKRNGKEIEADVLRWLKQVDNIITEHDRFLEDEDIAYAGCSNGFLPKPGIRYRLSRTANSMTRRVNNLQKTPNFGSVSYGLGPMSIDALLSDVGFESFKSRNAVMEQIVEALKDSKVRMIGVYGPGGVGKTTLVKKVARKAKKDKMFNVIVMANVTRNPDIKNIQGQLADMLGLRLDEETEFGRASRLRERLKKEKENTLVILDDLWAGLDLNKLGIPSDDDDLSQSTVKDDGMPNIDYNKTKEEKSSGDYRMCKILLTSRRKEVLSRMDVKGNKIFKIEVLKDKEAETLFKKVARVHEKTFEFQSLAAKISKKCAGLPMAVVTVGTALRNKNYFEWNDALRQLERQEFTGVGESLEFSTKLSFDNLENEELKSTFLLCAQMGHHPLTMDLMKYCIGLGIFEGFLTIREAHDRIHTLIGKLKDSSLLLDSYSSDRFNMHDMIRDVALSIASKERHVFTMRNGKLDDWPHNNELRRYCAISLHYCDINDKLPESINCPRLQIFHFDCTDPCLKIPKNFFGRMRELKVLILTGVDLSSFPTSIGGLTNLRMLCLEQCVLGDISIIGELKKLRILSLSGSKIESLPTKLGQLGKLQLFDISNCSKLRVIPLNVISSMNSLEELYMRNSLKWEVEENESENNILSELRHLHQLKTLDVCIPNAAALPRNLFLDKLDSYKIVVGDFKTQSVGDFKMPDKYEASRALAVQIKEYVDIHSQKGIKMLFRRVEKLLLGEIKNVQNIFYELNLEGFPCLKHFSIINNSEIECIINSMELSDPQDVFPLLESLCLFKLENMKRICYSKLRGKSFCKLKMIKIKICGELKNIFSLSMVKLLAELETIEVSECDSMENIIVKEEQDKDVKDDKIEFPKLRTLTLQTLPAFTGVYTNEQGVTTSTCLFSEQVAIHNLESLELSSINIQKIWSGQTTPRFSFQSLTKLNVKDCNGLNCLLSFSMAKSLENLKSMSVSGCEMMEKIFPSEGKKVRVFPKLEEIQLTNMERLTSIWHDPVSLGSFSSLNSVVIEKCKELRTIFPSHMVGRFCSLVSLKIVNCDSVEKMFDLEDAQQKGGRNETHLRSFHIEALPKLKHVWNGDPEGILSFKSLQIIEVYQCRDLEYLFPVSVAKGLTELDCLRVINCPKMEKIVSEAKPSADIIAFEFPEVTSVALAVLPELKSFYIGKHSLKWPKLKQLVVDKCDKLEVFKTEIANPEEQAIFLPEEIFSNLEIMAISLKEAERLKNRIRDYRMHHLKEIRLYSWKSVDILYWFLHRIPNLEKLALLGCFFKELLPNGSFPAQERIGTVVQLKNLRLFNLLVLENIGFERDPVLQRLEHLTLDRCPRLINLAPPSVTFIHLTSLEVCHCNGLTKVMAFSTAKSLVQLISMKVIECKLLEEIVAKQGNEEKEDVNNAVVFRKLMTLELVSLQNLTSFCSSKIQSFKFPSLEKLMLRGCPMMKIFAEQVTTAPNLQVHVGEEEEGKWYWEGDVNATIQKLFTDLVCFEYSKHFKLCDYPQLEHIWHGEVPFPDNCFYSLKTLVVKNCESLKYVIPCKLLSYLKSLEDLQVWKCSSVEGIFDTKMTTTEGKAFRLKKLSLGKLPNLKHVWNENSQAIVSFQNLQNVSVSDCEGLKFLFPVSVAKNLKKLETLFIEGCKALEEIVGNEEAAADGTAEGFEFPFLTLLSLIQLPELKCFYLRRHNLECPMLKFLRVYHCSKVKIFTSESQNNQEAHPVDQIGISIESQPFFSVPKVAPNLEEVTLNEKHTMMLWRGQFQENLQKLELLQLQCFHTVSETDILPFAFLQKIPNIKALYIVCSGFKHIFPSQRLEGDYISRFSQLSHLELKALPRLNSIGLEHSWLVPLLGDLKSLIVRQCPRLTKLVGSAVLFQNLRKLQIFRCDGLVYLFTSSAAKCLVELEEMVISECESMKEIVAKAGDELITEDGIIFKKLKVLTLLSLSSLESFYWGDSTLIFPSLILVNLRECPRMKSFSLGRTMAPLLVAIRVSLQTGGYRGMEDDLNTTIKQLFKEMVSFEYFEQLELAKYPELEQIWHGEITPPDNCFQNLKTLVVENCEFLSIVIPSNLHFHLKNLEELEVRNCSSVEVIFDINDRTEAKTEEKSRLKRLTLDQLPNMKHVWNENPQGILSFENFEKVQVTDCECLQTLFPSASVAKYLSKLQNLAIHNCGKLVEIVGMVEASVDGKIEEFEFRHLTSVTLKLLPELKCFYPGRMKLQIPMLKVLNVYHCCKLQIFASESQSYQKALDEDEVGLSIDSQSLFSVQQVIGCLEELSLNKEEANMLCNEDITADQVDKLKCLQLHCFHNAAQEDELPYGILRKLPNIETLVVACCDFEEIFPQTLELEFAQLRGLRLELLSNLNIIGLEHSCMDLLQKNLEILEVRGCPCLTRLVQSVVSFSNLKELVLNQCQGLEYLFTTPTARGLVQLKRLSVEKCESVKEMVTEEGDEIDLTNDEITFEHLRELSLISLSSLACFYSGSSTFKFPYLEEVIIAQCPKMNIFSQGSISAPLLPFIQASVDEKDWRWEGDLNTTVEKLYEEKAERDSSDAIGGRRRE